MKFYQFLVILVLIGASGCSWFTSREASKLSTSASPGQTIDFGRIIEKDILRKGGNIIFIPFSAGPGIEANDEQDKIALMIVDGFADVIEDGKTKLKIVTQVEKADFIIEGYITERAQPGKMKRWMPGNDSISLGVSGEIRSAKGDRLLAVFRHRKEDKTKNMTHRILGRNIGRETAQFLVSELQ